MVRGINPLRYQGEESEESTEWMDYVKIYFIPGMIVLAILGVMMFQLNSSGSDGGNMNLFGDNNIFKELGKVAFGSLK
jgi:hypothetical protein